MLNVAPSGTTTPKAVSVSRSEAWALSPPAYNGEALSAATGFSFKSPVETVQSRAFFKDPGAPKAYSGVQMSTPSAARSSPRRWMTDVLTISAVARRAGVRPSAIRYYESVGLVLALPRVNGRCRYGPDVLPRLALIAAAQQMGFTIAEITTLLHGFAPETPAAARWRALAERKLPEVEALITRAHEMKRLIEESLQCGCLSLEECALSLRSPLLDESPATTGSGDTTGAA